ncbi:MAG: hydrogenase maturation nickel metallochaperone HypA [Lachnospiraceae bacterium]|nr:hydrogenase maturation nickel metallochaperone HypA [Candidatus Equihabitans merdae]
MHELGVTFHIADAVVEVAKENQAEHVCSVTLELGEVSTVIPEYLIDVWNWHCKRVEILHNCELIVERIPAITYCEACQQTYPTVPQGKICPHCGSDKTYLQQGNEVNIKEIAVE